MTEIPSFLLQTLFFIRSNPQKFHWHRNNKPSPEPGKHPETRLKTGLFFITDLGSTFPLMQKV